MDTVKQQRGCAADRRSPAVNAASDAGWPSGSGLPKSDQGVRPPGAPDSQARSPSGRRGNSPRGPCHAAPKCLRWHATETLRSMRTRPRITARDVGRRRDDIRHYRPLRLGQRLAADYLIERAVRMERVA
jgi:hypothetical protein